MPRPCLTDEDLEIAENACRRLAERNRQNERLREANRWDRMADRIKRERTAKWQKR